MTPICRAEQYSDNHRPHVSLTYAEGHVIVVTNAGVVASLEATSGKVRWMTLYQRASLDSPNLLARPWFRYRRRTHPIVHRGTVLAAPADFPGIVALDLFSGRVLWETAMPADSFDAIEIVAATDRHIIAKRAAALVD